MRFLTYRPLISFVILTWLLSWPLWYASGVLSRRGAGPLDFHWFIAQIGVFAPSLAALFISAILRRELRQNSSRIALLYLLATGLAAVIASAKPQAKTDFSPLAASLAILLTAICILFFSHWNRSLRSPGLGTPYERVRLHWHISAVIALPALYLLAWALVNTGTRTWTVSTFHGSAGGFALTIVTVFAGNFVLGGALGEEIGWRGFLLPKLMERHNPLAASFVLGLVWALWHAPIDLAGGFGMNGIGAIVVRIFWTIPPTVVFTWFFLKTGGNLLVAILLHAGINTFGELGFSKLEESTMLLWLFLVVWAFVVGLSENMRRNPEPPQHAASVSG